MRIIETCPVCGADLYGICIDTYPEIRSKVCTKCGWSWEEKQEDVVRVPFVPPEQRTAPLNGRNEYMFGWIPECCRACSNHPSNGGSGMCACTLPYTSYTGGGTRDITTDHIVIKENE